MVSNRTTQLTAAGKTKLDEELAHLVNVKRPQLTDRLQEANDGDNSDTVEYEGLKDELIHVEARINELQFLLDHAEVVEHPNGDAVAFGSTVTIRGDDGVEETWSLVSHAEADTRDGSISTESPVGQALLGKRPGESATVQTPGGVIVYTVVRLE